MENLSVILKRRRKELGLTLAQVADAMGVAEATVQRWESGNIKSIRYEKIDRLAEVLDVNPASFMGWETGTDLPDGIEPMPKMKQIPVVGTIACGTPILAEQNIDDYVNIPEAIDADFSLRCKGDSMIDARIYDGDLVFVRQQPDVENGEIAAVIVDEDTATLKRVIKQPGQLILMPANSAHVPLFFSGSEMARVRIIGKAVSFLSAVR